MVDKGWVQNLNSGLDYGLDYGIDFGLTFGLDSIPVTNLVYWNFPGLPTVQFLIAYSLVPKVRIIYADFFFQRI